MSIAPAKITPVKFNSLAESDAEDWAQLKLGWSDFLQGTADRVLSHLELLDYDLGGLPVTQLVHCLQTATRAFQAGRDEEYVVCALLHDIGDMLSPTNHAEFAASMLTPYVSEANTWMIAHHDTFQGYYTYKFWGLDPDAREQFRGHPHFERTAEFCALFDQTSFDRTYEHMPLEAFRPMVHRVLSPSRLTSPL